MKITLNRQECKRVDELAVGEFGYAPLTGVPRTPGDFARPGKDLYPIMIPPMGACYRVTRTEDTLDLESVPAVTLDLEFVPAVQTVRKDAEYLVTETATHLFRNTVAALQADGWRVDAGSIRVTPDHAGGFSYVAIMRRGASDE